jgi:type I restriction-modification system DNA methylase subunit
MSHSKSKMNEQEWKHLMFSLLDKVRDGQSKYDGLDAMNEFNQVIILKLVENRLKDYGLDDDDKPGPNYQGCHFTKLYMSYIKNNNPHEHVTLFRLLYDNERIYDIERREDQIIKTVIPGMKDCVFDRLFRSSNLLDGRIFTDEKNRYTKFLPSHCDDVIEIFKKINETFKGKDLDDINFDALGNAYEQMKADILPGSKRYGQHFTNPLGTDYTIRELAPNWNEVCFDPACGTGGFVITFAKYIRERCTAEEYKHFITKNLRGTELLAEVYKILCFNMIAHGLEASLKDFDNISKGDSMDRGEFLNLRNKIDVIAANPPFGMKISPQNYPKELVEELGKAPNGSNSTALFLLLIYYCLKEGGRAGVIVEQGILNNGDKKTWYPGLRKFLVDKNKISKIVLLPDGFFAHTNFSTAMIFFTKGGETDNIIFKKAFFTDKSKKNIDWENGESWTVSKKNIINNGYSLNLKDYTRKKEEAKDGYVKLGTIVDINYGKRIIKSQNSICKTKEYCFPVYGGGNINFYAKEYNREGCTLIVSRFGVSPTCVRLVNGRIFLNDSALSIQVKNTKTLIFKYIAYFLLLNQRKVFDFADGSGQKNMKVDELMNNLTVPLPPLEVQERIVDYLEKKYTERAFEKPQPIQVIQEDDNESEEEDDEEENIIEEETEEPKRTRRMYDISKTIEYFDGKDIFRILVSEQYEAYNQLVRYQDMMEDLEYVQKTKNTVIDLMMRKAFKQSKMMKLGDVCNFVTGKFNSKDMSNKGNIPFYTTAVNSPVGFHHEYSLDLPEYIIFTKDGGNKNNQTSLTCGIGKSYLVSGKNAFTTHSIAFTSKGTTLTGYIYCYLAENRIKLMKQAKYNSGLGSIGIQVLKNYEIPIPPLPIQQQIVDRLNEINAEGHHYQVYTRCLQQELDNIMFMVDTAIETSDLVDKNTQEDEVIEEFESDEDEVKPKKKKSSKKKVKDESEEEDEVKPKKKKSSKKIVKDESEEEEEVKPKKKKSSKKIVKDESEEEEEEVKPKKKKSSKKRVVA